MYELLAVMHGDGDDCWRLSEQDRRTRHVVRSMAVAVRQGRQRRTTPHQLLLLQSPRITMLGARNSALLTLPAEDTNATCHCPWLQTWYLGVWAAQYETHPTSEVDVFQYVLSYTMQDSSIDALSLAAT